MGSSTLTIPRGSGSGGAGGIEYGLLADRPAGTDGMLYVADDAPASIYKDSGGWGSYTIPGFRDTLPPAASSFTKVGGDTWDTLTDDGDGLLLKSMGSNSNAVKTCCFVVAVPAAPYSFVVGVEFDNVYPANYGAIGICLTNGTSNPKIVTHEIAYSSGWYWAVNKYNDSTTWASNLSAMAISKDPNWDRTLWLLRIRDDNTNRYYDLSLNGRFWKTLASEGRTTHLTATHIGLWNWQGTTVVPLATLRNQARIFHWSAA